MDLAPGIIVAKRFRLDHLLGEGGMGTVWAATHTVTQRKHALKLLRPTAKAQQKRFVREARAASAVDHPNVMRIEDVFELEDGMPLLVLELLEGEPLSALLERKQKLTMEEMAEVLLPVVSAVGAAHVAGIIHRDLKPDNIFMSKAGVKVLDFGIAKLDLAAELASTEGALTKTGALIGTPFYMSPEQASGEPLDHRTDIWSLGIIAYQLLSGVIPTKADTVGAALKIVMTGRIAPLESHEVTLDAPLVDLIARMLALEPADRPDDLREVRDVLSRYSSVTTPDIGPVGKSAPREDEAGADIETGEWLAERAEDERPAATSEVSDDEDANHDPKPPTLTAGTTTAAATVAAVRPSETSSRWRTGAVLAAAVVLVGTYYASKATEAAPAAPPSSAVAQSPSAVASATAAASSVAAPRPPVLGLDALAKYRSHLKQQGAVLSSATWWTTAAEDFRAASAQPGAPASWKAAEHFARGHVWVRKGEHDKAIAAFAEATAIEPDWAEPYTGLSAAYLSTGQYDEALGAARQAQRLDPKWWRGVVCGARVLNKRKQIDEAIQEYRRALSMVPDSALVLAELALTYHAARLDSEATRHGEMALAIDKDMAPVHLMFAERALEKSDGATAVDEATRAVAISPRDVGSRLALGDALVLLGRRSEAEEAYKAMLALIVDGKAPDGVPQARIALVAKLIAEGKLPPPRVTKVVRGPAPRTSKSMGVPLPPRTNSPRSTAPSTEESYD